MKNWACSLFLYLLIPFIAKAQKDTLYVYGPGGPLSPFKECAEKFGRQKKVVVKVTGGPESNWIDEAKRNADVVFGGAEYMLTSFISAHPEMIAVSTRTSLYQRGAAILVRPGNPKHIQSMRDLGKKGIRILDINGAGQLGYWEDIVSRQNLIAAVGKNIRKSFANTALGIAEWKKDRDYDAWITYISWHKNLKDITEMIVIPDELQVYRGTPIALTQKGKNNTIATDFVSYLKTGQAHRIFQKWGWR
ncbi:substrate-binding domain-containing protein [Niabella hirudinis]|uniref:substrate-binding domain-containing protein n=1 Tax=Niabella hirudinis TaxID=1285929 RepID=UPI003EBF889F